MKNLILLLAIAGVFNYVDDKQNVPQWNWYSPEAEVFKVEFPNLQGIEVKNRGIESMELKGRSFTSKMPLGLLKFDNMECEVFLGELAQSSYGTVEMDHDRIKDQIKRELLAQLVSEREIDWLGYTAKEYVFDSKVSKKLATVRMFYDRKQNKLAQLIFVHPNNGDFRTEMERFFGSFELI